MLKRIIIALCVLSIIIPLALFFGMKLSPISLQLLEPINNENGLALQGYDPVAYQTMNQAVKGDPNNGILYNNQIYRFSSAENKLMFKTFPEKYAPQYGGYCATAVSEGFTADIDPLFWLVENNKLYLFFDSAAKNDFNHQINNQIIDKANNYWTP